MDRVTFATSSGLVWLALAVHFAAGLLSIVAGPVALSVEKGGRLHRQRVVDGGGTDTARGRAMARIAIRYCAY